MLILGVSLSPFSMVFIPLRDNSKESPRVGQEFHVASEPGLRETEKVLMSDHVPIPASLEAVKILCLPILLLGIAPENQLQPCYSLES